MATAHLSVKVGKSGKGTPHAEYIARVGKYAQRLEQGEKLEATESGNMPKWAQENPILFWQAADQYERKNGYVYREHEIALPRELNAEQRAELVREWVAQELGDKHAYTWAIHNKTALDGGEQPHVHLMYSERMNDGIERDPEQYFKRYNAKYPERGGAKKHNIQGTNTERKEALKEMRNRWEQMYNAHIDRHLPQNENAKISMKSLAEQGITDRRAEPHMTPSESAAKQREAEIRREAERWDMRAIRYEREQKAEKERVEQEYAEQERLKAEQKAAEIAQKQAEQRPYKDIDAGELVKKHQEIVGKYKDQKMLKSIVWEENEWFSKTQNRIMELDRQIADEESFAEQAAIKYHQERRERESSAFGMGKLWTKIKKENDEQKKMHDAYMHHKNAKRALEAEKKSLKTELDKRLETEITQTKIAFFREVRGIEKEILLRDKSEFTKDFDTFRSRLTTDEAKDVAFHWRSEAGAYKAMKDPVMERVCYVLGVDAMLKTEFSTLKANHEKQLAQEQQQRAEQERQVKRGGRGFGGRKISRGDDFGISD